MQRTFSDEELLAIAKKNSGGGGGGTTNYNQLDNKPQIGGVTLTGNKSASDLGLASATALANKVDKVDGKGLSTNDYTNTDKAIVAGVTAALAGKQDALTAGLYIEFDGNEISVKRDITKTAQEIEYNFTIPGDYTLRVKKYLNGDLVDTTDYQFNSVVEPINLDSIMEVSKKPGGGFYWVVKNLIASTTQAADYSVELYAFQTSTNYTQNFVATLDADKKLIIQSELDTALASKVNTSAIGVAGGVAGLGNDGKVPASQLPAQQELTAGQYVDITNDAISVQRDIARDVDAIITTSFDFPNCTVTKTINEEVVDTVTFSIFGDIPSSVMGVYSVSYNGQAMVLTFTNTVASKEHVVGYTFQVASYSSGVIDTQTFVETVDADKKLIIQSELDAAINAIKDGQSIDSFSDVETALSNKQDKYDTITYAQWQALTPTQQATKDYYISDYPSSVLTAGNIAYDNTSSGMAANKVQGAIDELKSGLTSVNDNISRIDNVPLYVTATNDIQLASEASGTISFTKSSFTIPSGYTANWGACIYSVVGAWGIACDYDACFNSGEPHFTDSNALVVNIKSHVSSGNVNFRAAVSIMITPTP